MRFLRPSYIFTCLGSFGLGMWAYAVFFSPKVPLLVFETSDEGGADKFLLHSKLRSEIRFNEKAQFRFSESNDLKLLVRYSRNGTMFSVEKQDKDWTQDLEIGFASLKFTGDEDNLVFRCTTTSRNSHEYVFYSLDPKCRGSGKGAKAGFYLKAKLHDKTFLPVVSCLREDTHIRYPSLNANCEAPTDKPDEFLGYIRSARIIQVL